jgi:signal transduction histidine kinase
VNAELTQQIAERNAALDALEKEKAERIKAEAMLHQAQKMEAVGQLTGGLAHDFNNLMTIVVGNLERLEDTFRDDPAISRSIRGAMEGATRGAALTQKLLAFGRRQSLLPRRIDVNELVGGMADLLRRAIGENIPVELELGAGVWPVEVDPNQLENVLLNLAVNARDAMPKGGRLSIQSRNVMDPLIGEVTSARGAFAMLSISDNGHGMSADTLSRAFEPFFTTKPLGEGSGLGLSQVYGFIKQSNGYIDIVSTLGSGTTIKMYLPRAQSEPARAAASTAGAALAVNPLGQAG